VWRRSFKEQFAMMVGARLLSARKQVVNESDGSLLPILASKASLVDDFTKDLGWGESRASSQRHSMRGGNAGREAGSRADVGSPRVGTGVRGAIGS
jgi:phage tail tape-measure protein